LVKLLIIADDLTGAIEAGVQLSKQKVSSKVILNTDTEMSSILNDNKINAVIINTKSRHLVPAKAANKVNRVIKQAKKSNIKYFYKKTDSTLRGNLGAELEAFIRGTNQLILPFIPAHPNLKRVTRKGNQYIGETLLHQTAFAKDPLEPVKSSFIPDILKQQTDIEICIADGKEILNSSKSDAENEKIIVFDCESETDYKKIGDKILQYGWQKAIAGTAGFVKILPQILQLESSEITYKNLKGPILLINGSLNNTSLQQVINANKNGITTFSLSKYLHSDTAETIAYYKHIIRKIKREFETGNDVIINTSDLNHQVRKHNYNKRHFHSISIQIGLIVSNILNEIPFKTLCVFGGDTLTGILNKIECNSIEPKSEIISGVALALIDSRIGKIHLISKPGGYGKKDVILQIVNHKKSNI